MSEKYFFPAGEKIFSRRVILFLLFLLLNDSEVYGVFHLLVKQGYVEHLLHIVYIVEGKLDIYFSFLVSFFDETTTNSNRIYVHQKHLNRWISDISELQSGAGTNTTITTTSSSYLDSQVQQYLLTKHPALKDIGKQLVKTYHILNPDDYNNLPTNLS